MITSNIRIFLKITFLINEEIHYLSDIHSLAHPMVIGSSAPGPWRKSSTWRACLPE